MKKWMKILAVTLCAITVFGLITPIFANADEPEYSDTLTTEIPESNETIPKETEDAAYATEPVSNDPIVTEPVEVETITTEPVSEETPIVTETPNITENKDNNIADKDANTDTNNNTENEETWDGKCLVTISLKGEPITEKTDNIIIQFYKKGGNAMKEKIVLSRDSNFTGTVKLIPDEYQIRCMGGDNHYGVELNENFVKINDARQSSLTLTVAKVQNNNFFAKFFRNNSILLILLVVSTITYIVLKKRREKAAMGMTTE